jgi:hypothetical protein
MRSSPGDLATYDQKYNSLVIFKFTQAHTCGCFDLALQVSQDGPDSLSLPTVNYFPSRSLAFDPICSPISQRALDSPHRKPHPRLIVFRSTKRASYDPSPTPNNHSPETFPSSMSSIPQLDIEYYSEPPSKSVPIKKSWYQNPKLSDITIAYDKNGS